jgi:F-type H+-transporting ATPase subunit b
MATPTEGIHSDPHVYEHLWLDPKFWVAVSFVIFFAIFGRMAWARIAPMIDARAARIRTELDEAQRLRAEAEALLRQAEADRAAALKEAEELLARARTEAERVAEAAAAEAEASAKRRERMAMDRIASAEAGAVAAVRNAAAEVAAVAARDVLAGSLDAEADAKLIDGAVADLPRALRAA